ncbi:GNAT family N-acetyltransferase [Geomesophilobacter sediminis]|uniref:GNAT family N-acetyltransferase n=1 Tax=Geomesophilobacter sediminis TaxID=2798584 RepID=UPI002E2880AF|nr:GNAT family N-acetyltransferase [Geomesophilobacter sediminis]
MADDFEIVVALDDGSKKDDKPGYWRGIFEHYVYENNPDRIFLVAEKAGTVVGFIVGEVRAWEFGSPPCGWVFAVTVTPEVRELGIGMRMFDEIGRRLKKMGVTTLRTMVDLDNKRALSFFRGIGMRSGRYIELEKHLLND